MTRRNSLDSNTRSTSIALLNARVADAIDLALAAKQAHWNLRGPRFLSAHEMLDTLRADLDGHVDLMAERVTALGGVAMGTTQAVAKATALAPYPTAIHDVADHLAAIADRIGTTANAVRANIDEAAAAGDPVTADIFTSVSANLDKWLWFIEAEHGE